MIRIGLVDGDIYSINLMKYINEHFDDMKIYVFSGEEALENYLKDNGIEGIIICDERVLDKERFSEYKVLNLTRNKNEGIKSDNTLNKGFCASLYKYQSLDLIHDNILQIFGLKDEGSTSANLFTGIYSPIGRSGKTKLAIDLCNQMTNAVYIGWETFSGMNNDEETSDIYNKFMYYLAEKNVKILSLLEKAKADNYRYLRGNYSFCDVKCIDKEMLLWLKELIKENDNQIGLVFDVGLNSICDYRILETMDKVYVPIVGDEISRRKILLFRNYINKKSVSTKNFYFIDEARNISRW